MQMRVICTAGYATRAAARPLPAAPASKHGERRCGTPQRALAGKAHLAPRELPPQSQ